MNQHQKTGLVVPPNDVAVLAQALNCLLGNAEIREKYGRAGRERVEKCFSKETMISKTVTAYESIFKQAVETLARGEGH